MFLKSDHVFFPSTDTERAASSKQRLKSRCALASKQLKKKALALQLSPGALRLESYACASASKRRSKCRRPQGSKRRLRAIWLESRSALARTSSELLAFFV